MPTAMVGSWNAPTKVNIARHGLFALPYLCVSPSTFVVASTTGKRSAGRARWKRRKLSIHCSKRHVLRASLVSILALVPRTLTGGEQFASMPAEH